MIMVEVAWERYRFTCARCDMWWGDFEVRVYRDVEGTEFAYFRHGGSACEAPLAADTLCPEYHAVEVAVVPARD